MHCTMLRQMIRALFVTLIPASSAENFPSELWKIYKMVFGLDFFTDIVK